MSWYPRNVPDVGQVAARGRAEDLGFPSIDLPGRLEEEPRIQDQLRHRDAAVGDALLAAQQVPRHERPIGPGQHVLCIWLTLPKALRILPTFISSPAGSDVSVRYPSSSSAPSGPYGDEEVGLCVRIDDGLERRLGFVELQRRRRLDVVVPNRAEEVADDRDVRD